MLVPTRDEHLSGRPSEVALGDEDSEAPSMFDN